MFNGYSTLGNVALRIAQDYIDFPMREATRYTVHQAIQKVCFDERSVAASNQNPAYIWCWFECRDGEATLEMDKFSLTQVPLAKNEYRYIPLLDEPAGGDLMGGWWKGDGEFSQDGSLTRAERTMLQNGLIFGQRFLCRYRVSYWTDYFGEFDEEREGEVIYVEPADSERIYIPLRNPFIPNRWNRNEPVAISAIG